MQQLVDESQPRERIAALQELLFLLEIDGQDLAEPVGQPYRVIEAPIQRFIQATEIIEHVLEDLGQRRVLGQKQQFLESSDTLARLRLIDELLHSATG